MGGVKQINIKHRTYHFYSDMINIKNVKPNLLKIDRKSYKNIGTYNTVYITIKKKRWLWKYLQRKSFVFAGESWRKKSENKELLKKYNNVWNGIKNKIKAVSTVSSKRLWLWKRLHEN